MQSLTLSTFGTLIFRQLGPGHGFFPFPSSHMRLATHVTVPIIIIPTSIVKPPYGLIVWASEAFAVLVGLEEVPVDVPVEVAELEVAAAVAGTEESFASVCNQNIVVSPFYSYRA